MKSILVENLEKLQSFKKVRTLEDLAHHADYNLMCTILLKWQALKPDNEEVNEMAKSLGRMFIYIHNLQSWRDNSEASWSEYRKDKNTALTADKNSRLKIAELELEIKRLKLLTNI
tara:strand:+ start:815 stop:1162 length:348 start_codon:yes stop_codon:yes gene_type:complete